MLADLNGAKLTNKTISEVVEDMDLTGRDIKQLLKLATLVASSKNGAKAKAITHEDIEFVHLFRPAGV